MRVEDAIKMLEAFKEDLAKAAGYVPITDEIRTIISICDRENLNLGSSYLGYTVDYLLARRDTMPSPCRYVEVCDRCINMLKGFEPKGKAKSKIDNAQKLYTLVERYDVALDCYCADIIDRISELQHVLRRRVLSDETKKELQLVSETIQSALEREKKPGSEINSSETSKYQSSIKGVMQQEEQSTGGPSLGDDDDEG